MSNRPFLVMLIVVLVLLGIALSLIDAVYGAPAARLPPVGEPTIPVTVTVTVEAGAVRSVDLSGVWLPFVACADCPTATATPVLVEVTMIPSATPTETATATPVPTGTIFIVTPTGTVAP